MKIQKMVGLVLVVMLWVVLATPLQAENFTLTDTEHKDVTTSYVYGTLYDSSSANILGGGNVNWLNTFDNSSISISGGSVDNLYAYDNSSSSICGSYVGDLYAMLSSSISISGGSVGWLYAYNTSTVLLNGYDFELGSGLSWDGNGQTILGTGLLSGKWFGETEQWTINIRYNDATSTIHVVPEPATLSLLALGTLSFLRRKHH